MTSERARCFTVALLFLLLSGCVNTTIQATPEDQTVPATHEGSDCVPMILSIMIGTATAEQAMAKAYATADKEAVQAYAMKNITAEAPVRPITKLRRSQVTDAFFLGFGGRCVEVVGTN